MRRGSIVVGICVLVASVGLSGSGIAAVSSGVAPTVGGFAPLWGLPGSVVTIHGSGFTSATAVRFFGVRATFTVDSDTQITARVPGSATTGRIKVTTPMGVGASVKGFDVLVAGPGWTQFRYDGSNSGYNPTETILSPGTVPALQVAWSRWMGSEVFATPAVADGVVYAASSAGQLSAFDARSGRPLWSASVGASIWSSPAVADGIVCVVAVRENKVYAFDAMSGSLLWATPGDPGFPSDSSPAIANGVVYVGLGDHYLHAYNARTGAELWRLVMPGGIDSSPAVVAGVVYVGAYQGVYAVDARAGTVRWLADVDYPFSNSAPAVTNGTVYISDDNGNLYALDAATGVLRWSRQTGSNLNSVAVANGVVYVGDYWGEVEARDGTTGALLWSQVTGRVYSSPTVANGVVYVGTEEPSTLAAFNAADGTPLWSTSTGHSGNTSSPVVTDGTVYIGAPNFRLYAYRLP
jgi:outer membrane protein assembly factor BamB